MEAGNRRDADDSVADALHSHAEHAEEHAEETLVSDALLSQAEQAEERPRGAGPSLSSICRRMREAAERQFASEIAEMGPSGNVAFFLSKALSRGLSCIISPLPRWELNTVDSV
ncbi:unnamed protein product, partial [Effrenium voratum]